MKQLKIIATLAFLGFVVSSCGKEGLSSDVSMELLPDSPLVIDADFTIGAGDDAETIKAPWFETRYLFKNDSKQNLVVVTLKYTITGYKNGANTTTEVTLDPAQDCADGTSRPYLAVVEPGERFSGLPDDGFDPGVSNCVPVTGSTVDYSTVTQLEPPNYERWYIDGLSESDNNYYTVQVEALGWFEKNGEITERLTLTSFFSTR